MADSYQAQRTAVGTTQTAAGSGVASNQNPAWNFRWFQASDTPEFGTFGQPMNLVFGATVANDMLSLSSTTFSEAKIENNTNTNLWADPQKGSAEFQFKYSTFVGAATMWFLDGKSGGGSGPLDTDDVIAVRTIIPVAAPALFLRYAGNNGGTTVNTGNLVFTGAAADTWFRVRFQWNRAAARTLQIQVDDDPGVYSASVLAQPRMFAVHQCLTGNDTANSFAHDQRRHYVFPDWTYDMCSTVWQDFEFTTVDQASLESRDHNSAQTWNLSGTTSRLTTNAGGAKNMPCQINFQAPTTSTKGLRNDLNATAQANVGITISATTQPVVFGAWVKTAALATNTTARIMFAGNSATSAVIALDQTDTGGQETLVLRNFAGTASTAINVSADTWYWVSILAQRNATCRLNVYDESGTLVGSVSDVIGNNASISSVRIGNDATSTSQSAGVYHYVQGFCYDFLSLVFPFKPWP